MGYEGDVLLMCPTNLDFTNAFAVVVSGDSWNPCGHALLNAGGTGGLYFQIAEFPYGYPKYMDEDGYQRYLLENTKAELFRFAITLPNPYGAIQELEQLMGQPWAQLLVVHNCGTFVETIAEAGGGTIGNYFTCPVMIGSMQTAPNPLPIKGW